MAISSFKDLTVWRESHKLSLEIYRITAGFPRHELFGVTSQLRRAAVSIPTNIAEGAGRRTGKEFVHFLFIARGSAQEVKYLCLLSRDLGYLPVNEWAALDKRYSGLDAGLFAFLMRVKQKTAA